MIAAAATSSSHPSSKSIPLLATLLKDPAMLMVLISLLLVTSTSMITNDYYDARQGVDLPHDTQRHPLAAGSIPLSVAKQFTKCLYATLMLSSAFVPSIMARLLILGGAMTTYLYTLHIKPKTWMKNISCAALVAMGPVTSGCAAWHVLQRSHSCGMNALLPWFCILQSPLTFLVMSLFTGIMG
jgi:4-hydroxybenzoate polyprenyltransferase